MQKGFNFPINRQHVTASC